MAGSLFPGRSAIRRAFSREALPGTLAAIGLVLAALSLVTPWYAVDISNQFAGGHFPLRTFSLTEQTTYNPEQTRLSVAYDADACFCPGIERAFSQAQLLAWTGALLAAFAFWAKGAMPRPKGALTLALTAVAALLLVAGPVLLALQLPQGFLEDHRSINGIPVAGHWGSSFWGSMAELNFFQSSWGPAVGWFLALLGGALTLAAVRRDKLPTAAEATTSPAAARPTPTPRSAPPASPKQAADASGNGPT